MNFQKKEKFVPTYNLQLLDFSSNYGREALPFRPRAHIALKSYSTITWQDKAVGKEIDFKVITPECVSLSEFNSQIEKLIQELKTIKRQAKDYFSERKKSS